MNNALKFLLLAAGCALVVLLITVGVKTANKGKEDTDGNLDQYSALAGEYEDIELKVYDSATVLGSEVKRLIDEKAGDKFLSIKVINGKSDEEDYINSSTITSGVASITATSAVTVSTSPKDTNYINDSGTFLCEMFYDLNGVVACLRFTQQ
jgi:hypothetical protein